MGVISLQIQVRRADYGDAPIIADLVRRLAAEFGEDTPVTEEDVHAYLGAAGNGVLLACVEADHVGMLSFNLRLNLFHAGPVCSIDELFVAPAARGRGVGKALVQRVLALAAGAGCREVSVSTLDDNEAAVGFYDKLGFSDRAVLLEQHLQLRRDTDHDS